MEEGTQEGRSVLEGSGLGGHELLMDDSDNSGSDEEKTYYAGLTAEEAINLVGSNGSYQKGLVFGLLLPAAALSIYFWQMTYMDSEPSFLCAHTDNPEVFFPCTKTDACSDIYIYKLDLESSLGNWVTDFSLSCGRESWVNILLYSFCGGLGFGSFFLAPFGDRWGRKAMLLLGLVCYALISLKAVFTEHLITMAVVLFGQGVFLAIFFIHIYILILESMTLRHQANFLAWLTQLFPLSGILTTFLMSHFMNWKILTIISSLLSFVIVGYFAYYTESPRFHLGNDEFREARTCLEKIAYYNKGRHLTYTFKNEGDQVSSSFEQLQNIRKSMRYRYIELFTACNMPSAMIGICFLAMFTTFAFSGMHMSHLNIFSDAYRDSYLIYIIDSVGIYFASLFLDRSGRAKGVGIPLLTGGVACLLLGLFLTLPHDYLSVLLCLTRFFLTAAMSGVIIYALEIPPTRLRANAMGLIGVFMILGIVGAMIIINLHSAPMWVWGVASLLGVLFIFLIPETAHTPLVEDIKEMQDRKSRSYTGNKQNILGGRQNIVVDVLKMIP